MTSKRQTREPTIHKVHIFQAKSSHSPGQIRVQFHTHGPIVPQLQDPPRVSMCRRPRVRMRRRRPPPGRHGPALRTRRLHPRLHAVPRRGLPPARGEGHVPAGLHRPPARNGPRTHRRHRVRSRHGSPRVTCGSPRVVCRPPRVVGRSPRANNSTGSLTRRAFHPRGLLRRSRNRRLRVPPQTRPRAAVHLAAYHAPPLVRPWPRPKSSQVPSPADRGPDRRSRRRRTASARPHVQRTGDGPLLRRAHTARVRLQSAPRRPVRAVPTKSGRDVVGQAPRRRLRRPAGSKASASSGVARATPST